MNKAIPSLMADFTGELHRLISEHLQCKRRKDKSVEPTPLYYLWSREAVANDATPYLMVLLLNNDVWCKSREVVVLRNLIEQAWGKVLDEDNSVTHLVVNRPGFPGECFICELRLPDHRFRWKHNKLFLLLPEEYGPAFPAIVDCYTSPPTLVWPVPLLHGFSSSYGVLPPLCKDH